MGLATVECAVVDRKKVAERDKQETTSALADGAAGRELLAQVFCNQGCELTGAESLGLLVCVCVCVSR